MHSIFDASKKHRVMITLVSDLKVSVIGFGFGFVARGGRGGGREVSDRWAELLCATGWLVSSFMFFQAAPMP